MPYSSVASLPEPVKAKLKGKKLRQWLHVFNSAYAKHKSDSIAFAEAWATVNKANGFVRKANVMADFHIFMPIAKIDKEKRTVSGYASTPTEDSDGEIVTLDAIRNALPEYMTYGNIREMHALKAVGKAKEANIDTKGLFLTAKIVDESAWQKCLEQVYQGFSIGGRKLDKEGNKITKIDLSEISVVDRPANPDCRITLAKSEKKIGDAEGYLVKVKEKLSPEKKALAKMAKVVEGLAKAGPPAAHDGFSLPAKKAEANASPKDDETQNNKAEGDEVKCEKHGVVNCEKCALEKREFDAKERNAAAESGAALPDGSFPIKNVEDLKNAIRAIGRAKDPSAAKAHIKTRAKVLGAEDELPDEWKKIKKMAKFLRKQALARALGLNSDETFLTLRKVERDDELRNMTKTEPSVEEFTMDKTEGATIALTTGDPLQDAILNLMKRAAVPSKAARMEMAKADMIKARKAMKECRQAIEDVHKMLKTSYLSKAKKAEKKPSDDDGDEFDHADAMSKLQAAFGKAQEARTFGKASIGSLEKAMSRAGQRGQEAGDAEAGFYEVPAGVKDLSPGDLSGAAPGTSGGGSQPPAYPGDGSVYPGKAQDTGDLRKYMDKNGNVPANIANLLLEKAQSEGELKALRAIPARGHRPPYTFDTTKIINNGTDNRQDLNKTLFDGVDVHALNSDDEQAHVAATAKVIGNMIGSGQFGKSILDPSFRGLAGMGKN